MTRPSRESDLEGRAIRFSKTVLLAAAALPPAFAIAVSIPRWIAFIGGRPLSGGEIALDGAAALGISPLLGGSILLAFSAASATAVYTVALFVLSRRAAEPFVAVVALAMLYTGSRVMIGPVLTADAEWAWLAVLVFAIQPVLAISAIYRFPDGRFVPRASVVALALLVCLEAGRVAAFLTGLSITDPIRLAELGFFASAVLSQRYRYRRVSTPNQQQQQKWVILAVSIVLLGLSTVLVQLVTPNALVPGTAQNFAFLLLFSCVTSVGAACVALGVAFGLLKYRLFDVDLVINRSVLYGTVAIVLVVAFGLLGLALEQVLGPTLRGQLDLVRPFTALVVVPAYFPVRRRLRPVVDRLLPASEPLALLFADIVASTELAVSLGDERWRQTLARFYATVRRELRAHAGSEVDTAGDGIFATFPHPTDAVRCALALLPAVNQLGLETRIGLHYGRCDMRGEKPSGVNVIIAARIMAAAGVNAILMSDDCRSAIEIDELALDSLGDRFLKGIPHAVAVYRVTAAP